MILTPLYSDFQPVGCGPSEGSWVSDKWVHIDINSQSKRSCLNCVAAIISICCLDGDDKLSTLLSYFYSIQLIRYTLFFLKSLKSLKWEILSKKPAHSVGLFLTDVKQQRGLYE